ncbi:hypothetical protein TNCT_617411 [Trichonephila clavata]|uniref:Uncharacterized protein n=1 Tax=Trichonephila clavata TaxID=2740835 RepID=A0A8X6FXN9_TRICU|nr:hypothetical protein TNCT_617411 [Trichonephila clavata]
MWSHVQQGKSYFQIGRRLLRLIWNRKKLGGNCYLVLENFAASLDNVASKLGSDWTIIASRSPINRVFSLPVKM